MRTLKMGRKEANEQADVLEMDSEKAALESLIDYAIQCAMETRAFNPDGATDNAKRYLCSTVMS